jgi:signal transduction histidine kinase
MRNVFSFLASRRWAGVGLALLVEAPLLLGLADTDAVDDVGIPAALVAAVGGTVAVVFGVWEGVGVAFAGAVAFAAAKGWATGELAVLAVWPAVVGAAGLFARRVSQQRLMLRTIVAAHERERQRLALTLHDDTAQALAGALMSLEFAERAAAAGQGEDASRQVRDLLRDTVGQVRAIAVELRPSALDDFGLEASVARLCADVQNRTGITVTLESEIGNSRLGIDTELTLYRAVQQALANIATHAGASAVRVTLRQTRGGATVVVEDDGKGFDTTNTSQHGLGLDELHHRLHLHGGRLKVTSAPGNGTTLTARIPA